MKKYSQYLFLLLVVSCAGNEKKAPPKTYSDDTNRAFEMIERGGSYYLKKAPVPAAPPQIEVPRRRMQQPVTVTPPAQPSQVLQAPTLSDEREEIVVDEKINYQAKPHTKAEELTPVLRNTQSSSKADERLIEINQNLAFYCMKHRKDPMFGGDDAKCMKFVNNVMSNCQKQHRIVNSKLLNCIQTKLKKRK
jgi:hypothetical protein